ncbi:hypothetical protein [Pseudoduganella lutea]|uniref:Uncharacterized protein n=1 Tax=Pseudoduganella lutea TaxID=321985 RepID=A0A4P6KXS7_9BURK|nr:hypothetical protein [Pseudoduganella lutea]QBE63991.1 hypothetical protein EWM63_14145 [Pseudoduganella lutea]
MTHSTFNHHFGPNQIWGAIGLGAITVCSGAVIGLESMGEEVAWMSFYAGAASLAAGVIGMGILQSWARRRAFVYPLHTALVWCLLIVTVPLSLLGPLFLWPSSGSIIGWILLEYFIVALGYQMWNTWRFFNAQWSSRQDALLARCFDPDRSMLAVTTLARDLDVHESLFFPYWHERAVAGMSVLLIAAMILAFILYGIFFEFALLAGGIVTLTCITYLVQSSFASLLLAFKVRQLERSHGCRIGLMDDAGVDRIKAAHRRAKRRSKR